MSKANKIISALFLAVAVMPCALFAFDWQSKPEPELYSDMLKHIDASALKCKDRRLAADMARFSAKLKAGDYSNGAWIAETYAFVQEELKKYPPDLKNASQRLAVLRIQDYPFHFDDHNADVDGKNVFSKATGALFQEIFNRQLKSIKETKVKKGAEIWFLYNMAFVIRTPNHTIAFDITSRPFIMGEMVKKGKYMSMKTPGITPPWNQEKGAEELAEEIDVLFISHKDGDHVCEPLAKAMLKKGKYVWAPEDVTSYNMKLKRFAPAFSGETFIKNENCDVDVPRDLNGIKVQAFHGNQGKGIASNVYLVEMDSIRIVHAGDNYEWKSKAKLKDFPAANIIIAATWNDVGATFNSALKAKGAAQAKQLFIPAHENELGHSVGHRESYKEMVERGDRLKDFKQPYLILFPGESYNYEK